MSLSLLFDAVPESLLKPAPKADSWEDNIHIHRDRLPQWHKKHLALLGLPDDPHQINKTLNGADQIRKALYPLKKGQGSYNIIDLGNLRPADSFESTAQRLRGVCETLVKKNIIPIILGQNHAYTLAQYEAYEAFGKLISVVNVDARLDMDDQPSAHSSQNHIQSLLTKKPNYLFSFDHLAYQSYLNAPATLEVLQELYFEASSVGTMREDFLEVEPIVRNADLLSFDISAIKMNDAPGQEQGHPLGLTGEEACQICWYAGLSNKLSSIGFFGFLPKKDERNQTALLLATMIWYFVEGYYHRIVLDDFNSNAFNKYVVSSLDNKGNLVFYKHKVAQKWWLEVPYPHEVSNQQESLVIPCSYKDYQQATRDELPDRWINTYNKLV